MENVEWYGRIVCVYLCPIIQVILLFYCYVMCA